MHFNPRGAYGDDKGGSMGFLNTNNDTNGFKTMMIVILPHRD